MTDITGIKVLSNDFTKVLFPSKLENFKEMEKLLETQELLKVKK